MRLVYLILIILIMNSINISDDWPMFMHDPQRTGTALGAAPDTAYLLWEYDAETPIAASPVVADGTVFLAAKGRMVALQADIGRIIWSQEILVIGSTPAVSSGKIFVGTASGFMALDYESGKLLWELKIWESEFNTESHPLHEFCVSSPITTGDLVFVGTGTNLEPTPQEGYETRRKERLPLQYIMCLNAETGEILWKAFLDGYVRSSPAFKDGIIYINSDASTCYALESTAGTIVWKLKFGYDSGTSPVVVDDTVIVVAEDGFRFDTAVSRISDGEFLWRSWEVREKVVATPAVYAGKVVVMTEKGDIYALDLETGDSLWKTSLNGEILIKDLFEFPFVSDSSAPAIADGKIYVGLDNGLFSCLDLETGEVMWQYQTEGAILAAPAVAYEKVFIASTDGKLYCFGIDPETYFEKGEKYEVQRDEERAQEFYIRAKEYYESQGNLEMVKECEEKLEGKTYFWIAVPVIICIIGALLLYRKMHKPSS